MTPKERMLAAFRKQPTDTIPVAPDIYAMIPCRLTGKPFWDVFYHNDPPLWRAYLDAVRFFQMDGWFIYGEIGLQHTDDQRTWNSEVVSRSSERFVVRTTCSTPAGDLWQETTYYAWDPPTVTRKWIKDLRRDMPKLRYFFPKISGCDPAPLREQMAAAGEDAAVANCGPIPGLHNLQELFDGGVISATYAMADCPEEFDELVSLQEEYYVRYAEMFIDAKPDFLEIGASGLWTLSSPAVFRKTSLPAIKRITTMCKQAGIPSFLHSCGKQREMLDILVNATDLDVVNPLEPRPMGDCDLGEIRRAFGNRVTLMGNVHTTDVMLRGTPDDVRRACTEAIEAAGRKGAFVLSTGDQCGRDTPLENIRAMVETARSSAASRQ